MSFLYPQFIWALAVLAIPVIIHLFNFKRYKTYYFSNTRFLQALQKKSQSFNRLKHLIILCCRMLVLALLVIAFAQPFFPASEETSEKGNYAAIYIDNSLSMKVRGPEGPLIDAARNKAVEILENLPDNFRVQILSNDFTARQQKYYTPREAITLVDEIQAAPAFRHQEDIKRRLLSTWENNASREDKLNVYLLSDFQKSQFEILENLEEENWAINLIKFEEAGTLHNLAIDTVWFEQAVFQPGFDQILKVQVQNYSLNEAANSSLKLELNDQLRGSQSIEIPPGSTQLIDFTIRPESRGDYSAKLTLDAGEPYFDNEFYFSFRVKEPVNILLIGNDEEKVFSRLYGDDIYKLRQSTSGNIDYSTLESANLVILHKIDEVSTGLSEALNSLLERGGNVVLIPDLENESATNHVLQNLNLPVISGINEGKFRTSDISYQDPIFKDVFLELPDNPQMPDVYKYSTFSRSTPFPLLNLDNGDAIISRFPIKNGNLILFALGLNREQSDLARHPILVPIMLNSALYSVGRSSIYTRAGSNSGQMFNIDDNSEAPLHIVYNEREIIPQQRRMGNKIKVFGLPSEIEAGSYPVGRNNEDHGVLAVNIDQRESAWNFWQTEEIENSSFAGKTEVLLANADNIGAKINADYNDSSLWRWFLAAALLFLILEILLIKLWSD